MIHFIHFSGDGSVFLMITVKLIQEIYTYLSGGAMHVLCVYVRVLCFYFFFCLINKKQYYHATFSINASHLLRFPVQSHLLGLSGAVFDAACHSQSAIKMFAFFTPKKYTANILQIYATTNWRRKKHTTASATAIKKRRKKQNTQRKTFTHYVDNLI